MNSTESLDALNTAGAADTTGATESSREEPMLGTETCPESGTDDIVDVLLQHPTQDSVALVFRQKYEGRLLYAHAHKCWYEWNGSRWVREATGKAFDYARGLARRMNSEGKTGPSSANFCKGVEEFACKDRAFACLGTKFDSDNYLMNTPQGTFDLRSKKLRSHDPGDLITKSTSVGPSRVGGDRFKRFLQEITGGDESLEYFLQVSLGACLSGAIESHWLIFWVGAGRNGKNTLGDLVMDVLGDYAKKIPASTLMAKSYEAHPTEIANLQGARLAVSSEVIDGTYWNEARINELTGDAMLSARFMRGDLFNFRRTHKHVIFGNHRPQLQSSTDALKSRIKIVPFTQSFVGREDAELPAALQREHGFVLNWLIEGHSAWLNSGRRLPACAAVEAETDDYFESQSSVDTWISEKICKVDDDGRSARSWPKANGLYSMYCKWTEGQGAEPVSLPRFGETMARHFKKVKGDGVRYVGALPKPTTYG